MQTRFTCLLSVSTDTLLTFQGTLGAANSPMFVVMLVYFTLMLVCLHKTILASIFQYEPLIVE